MLLDLALPRRCLACGTAVQGAGGVCPECWAGLTLIGEPMCEVCGRPFESEVFRGLVCGDCLAHPPAFGRARSVMVYDAASRPLVLGFKHADRLDAAPVLGRWMARAGAGLLADEGVLIAPVPLARRRLVSRRFNQSAALAQVIARVSGRAWSPDLLVRVRATRPQGGLGRAERARNVRAAFAVNTSRLRRPPGGVVLIDDVMTTGATVAACVSALRRAGISRVDVLTLCRVVLDNES